MTARIIGHAGYHHSQDFLLPASLTRMGTSSEIIFKQFEKRCMAASSLHGTRPEILIIIISRLKKIMLCESRMRCEIFRVAKNNGLIRKTGKLFEKDVITSEELRNIALPANWHQGILIINMTDLKYVYEV